MLELRNVKVAYGKAVALKEISLKVDDGEIVALIGANGAGKTTTLRTISNLISPISGEILFLDKNIIGIPPHRIVKMGVSHVMEGKGIFPDISVFDNLQMGAFSVGNKNEIMGSLDKIFAHFPILQARRKQLAGTLSGGEQQMLAIGCGLMGKPQILLLDEVSLGLAPLVVKVIAKILVQLHKEEHVTILLVDQNARMALKISDRAYVLETGNVVLQGKSSDLIKKEHVQNAYLGS